MERNTESTRSTFTWQSVAVLVLGTGIGIAATLFPGCAHLDAGAQVGASMAEHCGQPGLTDDERQACFEGYLEATLECAAQHDPKAVATDGEDTDGE